MKRNALRNHKKIIYKLKRKFGVPISVSVIIGQTNNYKTGKVVTSRDTVNIRRAVLLPRDTKMQETAPRSFSFDFGGYVDLEKRTLVIDKKDLRGYALTSEMRITYNGLDYGIDASSLSEDETGYTATLYHVPNQEYTTEFFLQNEDYTFLSNEDGSFLGL